MSGLLCARVTILLATAVQYMSCVTKLTEGQELQIWYFYLLSPELLKICCSTDTECLSCSTQCQSMLKWAVKSFDVAMPSVFLYPSESSACTVYPCTKDESAWVMLTCVGDKQTFLILENMSVYDTVYVHLCTLHACLDKAMASDMLTLAPAPLNYSNVGY